METLAVSSSHTSSLPATVSCAAAADADAWGVDADGDDGFIQDDDSVPACLSQQSAEADSEDDVLEALIQAELHKFQQQQAQKYAALLAEGQVLVMPMPSPAPQQQLLRAQQKQQDALEDAGSFEEQERSEYVPSARTSLDAEQLVQQHSSCWQSGPLQQDQALPAALHSSPASSFPVQPCSCQLPCICAESCIAEGVQAAPEASTALEADCHDGAAAQPPATLQAQCSTSDAAQQAGGSPSEQQLGAAECSQPGLVAGSGSCTPALALAMAPAVDPEQPVVAGEEELVEPMLLLCLQEQQQPLPQQQGATQLQVVLRQEPSQDQPLEEQDHQRQQLQQPECEQQQASRGPQCGSDYQACSTGDAHAEAGVGRHASSHAGVQQELQPPADSSVLQPAQQPLQQSLDDAVSPEALCAALAAAAGAPAARLAASDAGLSDTEGFIYQDDTQSASPGDSAGDSASPVPAARASGAASAQAGSSARASADAAVAALACAGEVSPWDTYTDDGLELGQQQQFSVQDDRALREGAPPSSKSRASPRARQQQQQQHLMSPRQHGSQQSHGQQHTGLGVGADLFASQPAPAAQYQQHQAPAAAAPLPSSIQGHPLLQGLSYNGRPRSAPVGGRSRADSSTRGAATAQCMLQAGQAAGVLSVVAESSQEGAGCCGGSCRRSPADQAPSPSRHRHHSSAASASIPQQRQQGGGEQSHMQLLARMQQLRVSDRPASAERWQRKQHGLLVYEQHQPQLQQLRPQRQQPQQQPQQLGRRAGPAWDDSPMALTIPKWVPLAQAVQLPSPAAAASLAVGGWGSSILAGSSGGWPAEAAAARDSSSRPHTAGPGMVLSRGWGSGPQEVLPHSSGCMTARSASASPPSRRSGARCLAAAAGGGASGSMPAGCGVVCGAGQGASRPQTGTREGKGSSAPSTSAYLFDVLQQVRQANGICRALGLGMQYRLAQGSSSSSSSSSSRSRKDRRQLEQIGVELWVLTGGSSSSGGSSEQGQQGRGTGGLCVPGSAGAESGGAAGHWQLRKKLSLQQFTAHLSRLRGGNTSPSPPASPAAVLAGGRPRGVSRFPGAADVVQGSSGHGGGRGGRVDSSDLLLLLSPRGSSSAAGVCPGQCLLRPASAPRVPHRGCSRLSSPRRS